MDQNLKAGDFVLGPWHQLLLVESVEDQDNIFVTDKDGQEYCFERKQLELYESLRFKPKEDMNV